MFIEEMNDLLIKDSTQQELCGAIERLMNGKSPRHDGILVDFFKQLWLAVGSNFNSIIKGSITQGVLDESVMKGVLSLFLRTWTRGGSYMNNWRPITLLTIIYKVLPKLCKDGYNLC